MKNSILVRMIIMLVIYVGLKYFGGEIGRQILYPIQLLVTFLHEFGHAMGALLTGGEVLEIQINKNGSGHTRSAGGTMPIILMGGYLGSAIFGNILFFIGARAKPLTKPLLGILSVAMIVTATYWFNSWFTTSFLLVFSSILIYIMLKTEFSGEVLMFLGLASILYIIQDFNVGPSSDLERYAEIMVILPVNVWMYIWLIVVVVLFFFNLRILFRSLEDAEY